MVEYCRAEVAETTGRGLHKGFRECCRKAWKDGFCKQHHPETAAAKAEKENEKYRLWEQSTRSYAAKQIELAREALLNDDQGLALAILNDYIEGWNK